MSNYDESEQLHRGYKLPALVGDAGHGRATHVQKEGAWASFVDSFQLCCKPTTALKTIKSWKKEKKKIKGEPVHPRENVAEMQKEREQKRTSPKGV